MTRFHLPHLGSVFKTLASPVPPPLPPCPPPFPPPPPAPFPNTHPVQLAAATLERGWISFFHQTENSVISQATFTEQESGISRGRVLSQPLLQSSRVPTGSWVTGSHLWALSPLLPIPRAQASPRSAALEGEASIAHSRTPWHWNPEPAAPHSHPEGSSCGGSECKATGHRSLQDRANH